MHILIGIFCYLEVVTVLACGPMLGTTPLLIAWIVNYFLAA